MINGEDHLMDKWNAFEVEIVDYRNYIHEKNIHPGEILLEEFLYSTRP